MTPENDKPPAAPEPTRPQDAAGALRASFEASLDEAVRTETPVGFDEIAAYVDDQLDDVDREIFETRMADDPALRAAVADLADMRVAMAARAGAGAAAGSRAGSWLRMSGLVAAAAAIVGAVIWLASTAVRQPSGGREASSIAKDGGAAPRPGPTPPAVAVALHDAGGMVSLDAAGAIAVPAAVTVPPALAADVINALRSGTLPPPALPRALRDTAPLTLLGDDASTHPPFAVVSPVATLVRERRPTLRWLPHPRARRYTVVVLTDALEPVATSAAISDTDTSWTVPIDLQPGTTYQWQVTAITPDGRALAPAPPQPEARFAVMSTAQRQTIDPQLDAVRSSNLLRGLILTRAGALDEAERAFAALAAENPTSARARELLTSIRTRRP
jgi:hypothetical protein